MLANVYHGLWDVILKTLDESEITRATVETIAENTVDGIIAPFFFLLSVALWGLFFIELQILWILC